MGHVACKGEEGIDNILWEILNDRNHSNVLGVDVTINIK
jgi:hypothetical protein